MMRMPTLNAFSFQRRRNIIKSATHNPENNMRVPHNTNV